MSAATRLWRHAPWWRVTVATVAAFAVLTALYPARYVERFVAPIGSDVFSKRPGTPPDARSAPPGSGAPDRAVAVAPPFDRPVGRSVRIAGHVVPLPPGRWHTVLLIRDDAQTEVNITVLARVDGQAVDGLILASGNVLPFAPGFHPSLPFQCFDSRTTVLGAPEDWENGTAHDCWYAAPLATDRVIDLAYAHLHAIGITTPATLGAATWQEIKGNDVERVIFAGPGDGSDALHREALPMRTARPALRRGFDGIAPGRNANRNGADDSRADAAAVGGH